MLTTEQLHGHTLLSVVKRGTGALYLGATIHYLVPAYQVKPGGNGVVVRRYFQVTAENPAEANQIASGTNIEVEVEVTADANYQYAMLEDPFPAGCEVEPVEDLSGRMAFTASEGEGGYARQEVHDDRVVFFFDQLRKGRTRFRYRLHAETPGIYHILPSIASLVYFPEIRGNAGMASVRIRDEGVGGR